MLKLTLVASDWSHGAWATSNAIAEKLGVTVEVIGTDGYAIETFQPPSAVPTPTPVVEVPAPVFTPVFTTPESAEPTNG
jgi:hypothetical protein